MAFNKPTVLISGGLDSAVTVLYLQYYGYKVSSGIFINRGQTNLLQERNSALAVANLFGIRFLEAQFFLPEFDELLSAETRKRFGIPARNLIFAALAIPYAHALGCDSVMLGNIISDEFPDTNSEFRKKLTTVASHVLQRELLFIAPLADWEKWDKKDEIKFAYELGYAELFGMTWTCWRNGVVHCGKCDACTSRHEGFIGAGIFDPTTYEVTQK